MGYLFLTGATGLLGSYLIRDLNRADVRLAVLVRPTRLATARQRVEAQLARWEKQAGHSLPRPVVLEGDLSRPDLGLDEGSLAWVSENCDALMHNAASLTFHAQSPDDEPWRSNVRGTAHVLEFCRRTGIRRFHHVSTAYVCGLREDRVFETDVDVGQTLGNDYETSKLQAEQAVRSAEFLDELTVYRPGIILGDSRNGYTTTFHGFYVPLKLVSTLIKKTAGKDTPRELVEMGIRAGSERLRQILNLNGHERKNYVPVDWVSAVMAHIYSHPEHHGRTYHLTPPEPVEIRLTQDVMEQAFLKYTELTSEATETNVDWDEFEPMFINGMNVYRSYWRDDPEFDITNTLQAAPHLPCPELDADLIMRMCKFAIETNFGWPRPALPTPDLDVHAHLAGLTADAARSADAAAAGEPPRYLGLQVNGLGGGQWELALQGGRVVAANQGLTPRCTATFYLNTQTFRQLAACESTVDQAIRAGRVLIEGNGMPPNELANTLEQVAARQQTSSADPGNGRP